MHGKAGKGEQGAERDSTAGGGPARGALPWYLSMAGPAMNGTQAQPRVRITSHVRSKDIGPRSSQEVDPIGQDPGQQGTQWVTLPGTHSAAMPPQPSWSGSHLSLKAAPKSKGGNTLLGKAVQGELHRDILHLHHKMYPGSDEGAGTEQRQLNMVRGRE